MAIGNRTAKSYPPIFSIFGCLFCLQHPPQHIIPPLDTCFLEGFWPFGTHQNVELNDRAYSLFILAPHFPQLNHNLLRAGICLLLFTLSSKTYMDDIIQRNRENNKDKARWHNWGGVRKDKVSTLISQARALPAIFCIFIRRAWMRPFAKRCFAMMQRM